jgi:hypothetical protein
MVNLINDMVGAPSEISNSHRNSNNRNLLEIDNNESTSNIHSYIELNNMVESLKDHIQQGSLINMKECEITNIIHSVITCKDSSIEQESKIYIDFINFLEIYETRYQDKYNDLVKHILDNLTVEETQTFPRDNNGNILLLSKPRLERNYNDNYITSVIRDDNMYKLTLSITCTMKNIFQYETDYSRTNPSISSTSSTSSTSSHGL